MLFPIRKEGKSKGQEHSKALHYRSLKGKRTAVVNNVPIGTYLMFERCSCFYSQKQDIKRSEYAVNGY